MNRSAFRSARGHLQTWRGRACAPQISNSVAGGIGMRGSMPELGLDDAPANKHELAYRLIRERIEAALAVLEGYATSLAASHLSVDDFARWREFAHG